MDQNNPGTSTGVHDITFVKTERGQRMLVRHGYTYNFHRETKFATVWRCTSRSCNAIIKISERHGITILHEAAHKCQPNLVKVDITSIKAKNQCKQDAANTSSPMPQLYEKAFKKSKDAGYELLKAIPKFANISRSLYNARNKALNVPKTNFSKCEDVIIPEKYKQFFLLFDDESDPKNRVIAFCTEYAREVIPTLQTFILDGTFSSCCSPFYQLYCIHGDVNSDDSHTNIVPLIFVLMPNKQEQTYERLFALLKYHLPTWTPVTMVVDFEVAVINVIKIMFPGVELQGCNFHFKQALERKAHKLQINSLEQKRHLAMCASLAYVKTEDIDDAWLNIMENAPQDEAITKFNDYFVSQWLENPNVGLIWNVFGAHHRTISLAESWHKRLNNKVGKVKPNLLQFLDIIKDEADYADGKLRQLSLNIPVNKRSRRSIEFDREVKTIMDNYDTMTIAEFLKKICVLQTFKNLYILWGYYKLLIHLYLVDVECRELFYTLLR